jgi:hypothetical protein
MGIRGELFSTKVTVENRTYFFNIKENRMGDVFLNIVESKKMESQEFDRHAIVLFKDDMKEFLTGLDKALHFMEKSLQKREVEARSRRTEATKRATTGDPKKRVVISRKDDPEAPKKTEHHVSGKLHVVARKRTPKSDK